ISLYEMATGRRPFRETSEYSIMAAQINQPPTPPIELKPNLPPALNEIILVAIAKDPNARFQSADAFKNALSRVVSGGAQQSDRTVTSVGAFAPAASSQTATASVPATFARQPQT